MLLGPAYLWRTLPDGRRLVSRRLWILIWVAPALFVLAGAGMLAIEGWKHLTRVPTEAEVVRVYDWSPLYGPVFRYTWSDGQPTEATSGTAYARRFEVGERHVIRYDPARKTDVTLPGWHNWLPGLIVGGIGAVLALPALWATRRIRRWQAVGTAL